jgi:hypothetical protein
LKPQRAGVSEYHGEKKMKTATTNIGDLDVSFKGTVASRVRTEAAKENLTIAEYLQKAISLQESLAFEIARGNRIVIADAGGRPFKELKK